MVDHTANAYIFSGYFFIYANIDITAVNVGVHMYTNMNIEDSIVDWIMPIFSTSLSSAIIFKPENRNRLKNGGDI